MGITRPRWRFPSPALIISCLALFAALGGGAYAASSIGLTTIHFTNPTLKNGWGNVGQTYAPAGYAKDSSGVVHLRGTIHGASVGTTAFMLPSGARPSHLLYVGAYTAGSTFGSLEIEPNGDVVPWGSESTTFTSLDGISFAAGE
jgi:hypothetical protein